MIPSAVLPNLYKLADDNYKRDGHQFYVDGTPVARRRLTQRHAQWRTILVGGLNAGGKGYYALDVTDPERRRRRCGNSSRSGTGRCPAGRPAAGIYADCNLGLTFGKPVITKLAAGTWVVIVTSGYNNAQRRPRRRRRLCLCARRHHRQMIHKIATGVRRRAATPSGLAQINNYVTTSPSTTPRCAPTAATCSATSGASTSGNGDRARAPIAKDAPNNAQPITIRPELAELDGKPFVLVGTGKYLGGSDVTDAQRQSVYGIKDPLTGSSPIYADPLRSSLRPMKIGNVAAAAGAVGPSPAPAPMAIAPAPAGCWTFPRPASASTSR